MKRKNILLSSLAASALLLATNVSAEETTEALSSTAEPVVASSTESSTEVTTSPVSESSSEASVATVAESSPSESTQVTATETSSSQADTPVASQDSDDKVRLDWATVQKEAVAGVPQELVGTWTFSEKDVSNPSKIVLTVQEDGEINQTFTSLATGKVSTAKPDKIVKYYSLGDGAYALFDANGNDLGRRFNLYNSNGGEGSGFFDEKFAAIVQNGLLGAVRFVNYDSETSPYEKGTTSLSYSQVLEDKSVDETSSTTSKATENIEESTVVGKVTDETPSVPTSSSKSTSSQAEVDALKNSDFSSLAGTWTATDAVIGIDANGNKTTTTATLKLSSDGRLLPGNSTSEIELSYVKTTEAGLLMFEPKSLAGQAHDAITLIAPKGVAFEDSDSSQTRVIIPTPVGYYIYYLTSTPSTSDVVSDKTVTSETGASTYAQSNPSDYQVLVDKVEQAMTGSSSSAKSQPKGQTTQANKGLPSTGETTSLVGLAGLGLLAMVGSLAKKRQED